DHDELNALLAQGSEQSAKIELPQRTLAAPWMALSCLQSAWTRARRSLIEARRSASRRRSLARCKSPISPLNVLAATQASLAALLALLAFVPPAHATYDPLGSGTTKLTLDKGFASFLGRDGITLSAKAGAKKKGTSFTLPVTEGNLDPTLGKGEI